MEALTLLERFGCGVTPYILLELESSRTSRAVIVPIGQDGSSLAGGVYAADLGKRLVDVQPGDSLIVLGLPERVRCVEVFHAQAG